MTRDFELLKIILADLSVSKLHQDNEEEKQLFNLKLQRLGEEVPTTAARIILEICLNFVLINQ